MEQKLSKANGLALIPFLIFIGIYLITGMVLNARGMEMAFYQLPAPIAKDISERYEVDPKRTASLLDIFACIFQGILPYGAQMLFACALMENLNSPFQVITKCWYQYILMLFAVLSICFTKEKKS